MSKVMGSVVAVAVRRAVVIGVLAVCPVLGGCTLSIGSPNNAVPSAAPSGPRVSREGLATDISVRLAHAGQRPVSVSCPEDLLGQVGATTRCAVVMSETNSFEPRVTVTSVAGDKISYDVIPAVSKSQLEASVSAQVSQSSRTPVQGVACESGLDGTVGATAHCAVTAAGATVRRTVEVTTVTGFAMNYQVVPILLKAVVEDSLRVQLGQAGLRPDAVTCADNLDGTPGNTVECTALTAGTAKTFILTVTTVTGTNITYTYAPKP